ncbi:MAG: hypothetical protein JNK58_01820, partial [Phycisphaerae bacterium]|nr:hypothetical protein [Phycisphaerae bacterium]
LTDARGLVRFDHLPDRTVLIHAFLAGVGEAVTGVVIGSDDAGVQLVLRGIGEPSPIPNNDFSLGLLGWEVGESPVALVPHEELIQGQVDNDLRLMTDFEGPVSVSRTFVSKPGVRTARVRYRFITSEIPGGYCGSIYNDYYSVSIRALAGAATSDSASMNSLGCAAFDAQGKTAWKELTLPVAEQGDVVQVDVSVANVGDGAFDSSVVLDFVAEQTLNIETVSLRDIDNEPLQFLSASPHPYLGGLTPVHGSIRIIGAEDDALADLTLELLEGSQVVATGLLAPGAMATLLAPFGSDGAVEMTSPARLFEVPASQFPLVCRPESSLQLRIRATSAGGESVTRELGTKPMLVLYDGNNRYGERDSAEGGDGWTRPSLLCMLSHFLSSGLLYNDMSNMHGGRFHPHSSHADGTHVDAWFSGYNERDAMTAAKLISLLNDPTFGGRIRRVLVTYPASETHPFRLVINKTILDDGRPASNVIRHAQKHERHFHLMLSTSN